MEVPLSNDAQLRQSDDPNIALQESPEFVELRSKFRRFVFPVTIAFLAWYFLYVLLAVLAHDFMGTRVFGNITWGLILGLLQFVSTFAITMAYARWADREFDPAAEALAKKIEAHR
jgi:uncharacterized membrane protein (DUF485 family)